MTIGKNIDVQKVVTKKDLGELAKLMILNILSVKGVIWTHYKNKRKEANEKKQKTKRKRLNKTT